MQNKTFSLKIVTLNVNGIARTQKRQQMFAYLRTLQADIYCLQETHGCSKIETQKWTEEWGGQGFWSLGSKHGRGVAILLRPHLDIDITEKTVDDDGRIISLIMQHNEAEINMIGIYAPTDDTPRRRFFETLRNFTITTQYCIVAGDFNCIADLTVDKVGGNPARGLAGNAELMTWTNTLGINDAWRAQHPKTRKFTWSKADQSIQTRIDRIFIPKELIGKADSSIVVCPLSDHETVTTTIPFPTEQPRGPGVWKLNNDLLKNSIYRHDINTLLDYWLTQQESYDDIGEWWEEIKQHIKRVSVKNAVRLARKRDSEKRNILQKINQLKDQGTDVAELENETKRFEGILAEEAKGSIIRSRAVWYERGEKPTRYFFGLEKHQQKRNTIKALKTENGRVTSNIETLQVAQNFYEQLYRAEATDPVKQQTFLDGIKQTLTEAEQETCEGPITDLELTSTLRSMTNNKSPGMDGLTREFYVQFWDRLSQPLEALANQNYNVMAMTTSQRRALLKLLFKKDDEELLKNWRPISLLNTDYKIIAKVLALRLRKVLPAVIHPDQTCGSIQENIMKIRDIVHHTGNNGQVVIISLDQEKAFDRVDRGYLLKVLDKMNFGEDFQRWVQTLYFGATATISNNGWLSDPVPLQRGLRQGCPLSPLLYTIFAEPMAIAIRDNHRIKGIHIPGGKGRESKLTQYADDMTLLLADDRSVSTAFDIVETYQQASGGKLNLTKTEGMYFGKQIGRAHGPAAIKWRTDSLEILGTVISKGMQQKWGKPLEKLEKTLQLWSSRQLSIQGRALIARTYGLATILYLTTCFTAPNEVIARITEAIFRFIWQKGTEYVKRDTIQQLRQHGGLNLPDLKLVSQAVKTKWALKITDKSITTDWALWARYNIGMVVATLKHEWDFLRRNDRPHRDGTSLPEWYREPRLFIQTRRDDLTAMIERGGSITTKSLRLLGDRKELRAEQKWRDQGVNADTVANQWESNWNGLNTSQEQDLRWRALHWSLPTRERLSKWRGLQIPAHCPFCPHTETMAHMFYECERLKKLWDSVNKILKKLDLQPITDFKQTLIFQRKTETDILKEYLATSANYIAWISRVKKSKDNIDTPDLSQELIQRIKQRINIDIVNRKTKRIEEIWAHRKVLIDTTGTKVVHLL